MQLRNVMEDLVESALAETLPRHPDVCGCDRCRIDMKAFALNNLPPRYVVDEPGTVHQHLETITLPLRGDVLYSVQWAVRMVGARPRHPQSLAGRHSRAD